MLSAVHFMSHNDYSISENFVLERHLVSVGNSLCRVSQVPIYVTMLGLGDKGIYLLGHWGITQISKFL